MGPAEDTNSEARSCNTLPLGSQLGGETTAPHPHPLLVALGVTLKRGYISNPLILENTLKEVHAVMLVCVQSLGSADLSPTPCWFTSFKQPCPAATSSGGAHAPGKPSCKDLSQPWAQRTSCWGAAVRWSILEDKTQVLGMGHSLGTCFCGSCTQHLFLFD